MRGSRITYVISIHALLAESDRTGLTCGGGRIISIHALLAESDRREGPRCQGLSEFLSTLSLRRATGCEIVSIERCSLFLSTLSLRRATWATCGPAGGRTFLSTLSLRRATCARLPACFVVLRFLSTLSLRRATNALRQIVNRRKYFYPRSPCGERPDRQH